MKYVIQPDYATADALDRSLPTLVNAHGSQWSTVYKRSTDGAFGLQFAEAIRPFIGAAPVIVDEVLTPGTDAQGEPIQISDWSQYVPPVPPQ